MAQHKYLKMSHRAKKRRIAGWVVLAAISAMLTGCATDGKVVKPVPEDQPTPSARGTSVVRFENGRDGFVITETTPMNEALRSDFDRAVAHLNEQDYVPAIELLEKIIEQGPGLTAPHINIAIAYARTGKRELAEAHFKTALRLVPGHPVACNEYGLLHRKTGRFEEARTLYQEAIARFPEYSPAHKNLGILCDLYLNDPACALAHYEIYSRANPEDKKVKLWIADLRARLERNQAAGSN